MKVIFHKHFEKRFSMLPINSKKKFQEQMAIFFKDQFDPVLNNHALAGNYKGYRSININGDLRALYKSLKGDVFVFIVVDNHNNLYK